MAELFAVPIEETVAPQPSTEASQDQEAAPAVEAVSDEPINLIEPPAPVVETAAQRADRLHVENNERR